MVSAGTTAGFLAIRDSSKTHRQQECWVMCPYGPAEDAHSLDRVLRNLGFVLQIHIFNTLETPAFLRSLITCLGQSSCSFLENSLLWYLNMTLTATKCFSVPPACLASRSEEQDRYLISEINGEVMRGSKGRGRWGWDREDLGHHLLMPPTGGVWQWRMDTVTKPTSPAGRESGFPPSWR